mgnify:CR=1 FL=1
MELNFDLGIKEYTVKGANGNMVIRFCTTDANFEMRDAIDELFGCPICGGIFGTINLYASAGGSPIWLNFMNAVIDQFDDEIKRERFLAGEKAKKYTNKYTNHVV